MTAKDLLDAQRDALIAGRLGDLDPAALEALEARLREGEPDAEELGRLRPILERNMRLVEAARRGVARAALLIGRSGVHAPTAVYGEDGETERLTANAARFRERL